MNVEGKVALITGGGSGLGEAAARSLARAGAKVAVIGRTEEEIRKVAESITKDGGEALAVVADISKPESIAAGVEQVVKQWGRLDILFANAGINGVWAPVEDLKIEEWQQTIDINLIMGLVFTVFVLLVPQGIVPTVRKFWSDRADARTAPTGKEAKRHG